MMRKTYLSALKDRMRSLGLLQGQGNSSTAVEIQAEESSAKSCPKTTSTLTTERIGLYMSQHSDVPEYYASSTDSEAEALEQLVAMRRDSKINTAVDSID